MNNYQKGDLVEFIDLERHATSPQHFPPLQTVETVTDVCATLSDGSQILLVQWPSGSTSGYDKWAVHEKAIRRYQP